MTTDIVLFRPINELAAMRQHLGDLRNSKLLISGVDYSIIPGTNNSKPTLMKPGAEKLLQAYNLSCQLDITERVMDWEAGLFYFSYRATVSDTSGRVLAAAEGSANSRETKYRYRNVNENKATDADKRDAVRTEIKKGQYGQYTVYVIENRDPADLINTLQKMAQKRAMVAAVLIAVGASEFFTQDVEDFSHIIDGEVIEEQPQRQPRPAQRQQPATQTAAPQEQQEGEPAERNWTYYANAIEKAGRNFFAAEWPAAKREFLKGGSYADMPIEALAAFLKTVDPTSA